MIQALLGLETASKQRLLRPVPVENGLHRTVCRAGMSCGQRAAVLSLSNEENPVDKPCGEPYQLG